MKMQIKLEGKIKEKLFYYPTTFDKLDEIVRYGLSKQTGEDGIKLYPSSSDANNQTAGQGNAFFIILRVYYTNIINKCKPQYANN